eukprot:1388185-Amphidinium_carterae.1
MRIPSWIPIRNTLPGKSSSISLGALKSSTSIMNGLYSRRSVSSRILDDSGQGAIKPAAVENVEKRVDPQDTHCMESSKRDCCLGCSVICTDAVCASRSCPPKKEPRLESRVAIAKVSQFNATTACTLSHFHFQFFW